jgi:PAS domain S-box-containing protein
MIGTVVNEGAADLRLGDAIVECVSDAIMVTDLTARVLRVNPAFSRITGYASHEMLGQNPRVLSSGRHSKVFYSEMWSELTGKGT